MLELSIIRGLGRAPTRIRTLGCFRSNGGHLAPWAIGSLVLLTWIPAVSSAVVRRFAAGASISYAESTTVTPYKTSFPNWKMASVRVGLKKVIVTPADVSACLISVANGEVSSASALYKICTSIGASQEYVLAACLADSRNELTNLAACSADKWRGCLSPSSTL